MINISEKILVALKPNGNNLPTTEICPIGKSSGERKKMETLRSRNKEVLELENKPLPGFTLTSSGRRGWGSTETCWTIIDPRGFTSVITSSNLENILHCTGITEGLIQEKCVWARENERVTMVLIPTSSEDYTEAIKNTEILNNKVSKKDINLGDKVLLQNKLTGIYLGTVSLYSLTNKKYGSGDMETEVIGRRQIIQVTPSAYYYQSDLKIVSVVEEAETVLTKQEAMSMLRDSLDKNHIFTSYEHAVKAATPPSYGIKIKHLSHTYLSPKDVKLSFEEIDEKEAAKLYKQGYDEEDMGVLLLEDKNGNTFVVDQPGSYQKSRTSYHASSFLVTQVLAIDGNSLEIHPSLMSAKKSGYSYGRNDPPPTLYSLVQFEKFYKIVKHIKTESYV